MRSVSNNNRSFGYGETPGENGDFTDSNKEFFQKLIKKANTVPIAKIFRSYGFRVSEQEKRIICPFKSHKNGRESTPSMTYFPQTNSFFCYGCKVGGGSCAFVSEMDGISKSKAAFKIINNFQVDANDEAQINTQSFSEKLEIMLNFSNAVREFRLNFNDQKSSEFIKNICMVYDNMCLKHELDNEALSFMVNSLKEKIEEYNK